jgi:dTDP-4-amino-4,6-dideoxygalactose transaminase
LFERAIPIFVDIDPKTLNIDPQQVSQAVYDLTQGGKAAEKWLPPSIPIDRFVPTKLKGILTVDVFGQPVDYDPILKIAKKFDLTVIEDCCEALGAEYKGQKAGTLGDVGVFAFYPNKQMTTGEGGMIVTDCQDWRDLCRSFRNQGRDVFDPWLNHTRLGYNYRLDEMSAALGLSQLKRIESLLTKREHIADKYNRFFHDMECVIEPFIASTTTRMSWFVYVVRFPGEVDRNRIIQELQKKEIPSRPYFSPIHLQPFYEKEFGYKKGFFPETEMAGESCLALPFSGVMKNEQVEYVCENIKKICL